MLHHNVSGPGRSRGTSPPRWSPRPFTHCRPTTPSGPERPVVVIDQGVLRRLHHADPDTARGRRWAVNNLTVNALMAAFAKNQVIVDVTADRTAIT